MNTLKIPSDSHNHSGEFIVFYPNEKNPQILFSSPFAEQAYDKAKEIVSSSKKEPVVMRIAEKNNSNVSQMICARI